ncbi:DUF4176 domain-containing protein [Leifsonia sp. NPDC077715]|uniref:DUF4176 domain-containing protein n=1 Tax=Leifsonia sp. NPDC077715 TaxID=3155539 RepID=UPI003441E537
MTMALELQGALLGLGSIVRLESENWTGLFVVLARGAYRPHQEHNEVVPRYLLAPHPYGEAPDQETFPLLASEIVEVVFEGYTDDADAAFLADLLDQMENGARPVVRATQFTEELTAIPAARPEKAEPGEIADTVGDPFFELRRLVEQEYGKGE